MTKLKPRFKNRNAPQAKQVDWVAGESKTQQHFREEVDINNIVEKFKRTGRLDGVPNAQPQYGDISALDFMTMQKAVTRMNAWFMKQPAKIRNLFNNSPAQYLEYIQDPTNKAEAQKLGLLPPDPKPATPPQSEPKKAEEAPK